MTKKKDKLQKRWERQMDGCQRNPEIIRQLVKRFFA